MTPSSGNKSPAGRIVSTILPSVSGDSGTSEHGTSAASVAAQYLNNTDNLILSSHGDARLQDRNGPIASPMSSSDSTGGGDSRLTTSPFKRLNGHGSSSSRRGAGGEHDSHRSSSSKTKCEGVQEHPGRRGAGGLPESQRVLIRTPRNQYSSSNTKMIKFFEIPWN